MLAREAEVGVMTSNEPHGCLSGSEFCGPVPPGRLGSAGPSVGPVPSSLPADTMGILGPAFPAMNFSPKLLHSWHSCR